MIRFLPPCASVALFLILWRGGYLSRLELVGGFVVLGVVGQILAPAYSTVWFAAVLLNLCVALYLAILLKLS
jgi:hypothetical protein